MNNFSTPRRTDNEVRASIISAAESCESALCLEAFEFEQGNFASAAHFADVAQWDSMRAFRMAERFA